jgi:hypothetical protein
MQLGAGRVRLGWLAAVFAVALAGCVDQTVPGRVTDLNQGSQSLRESAILLNILRASRSEPLHFVAMSRFTGTASANVNGTLLDNVIGKFGAPNQTAVGSSGSVAAGATLGNSFDVGVLENRDFYGGFMSPLDLESLNLLMNAGLNREIVLHSVLQGVRVSNRKTGEPALFENRPDDDAWTEGRANEPNSPRCKALYPAGPTGEANFEPVASSPVWKRMRDCRYQKFLYFLRLAVRFGITVEAVPVEGGAGRGKRGLKPGEAPRMESAPPTRDSGREELRPAARYVVCFDPAIARENGFEKVKINDPGACGRRRQPGDTNEFRFIFNEGFILDAIVPIVRSPYAVFQFYGQLLQGQSINEVKLSQPARARDPRREARLLTIEKGGTDCFARTTYAGADYCVPNAESRNTKEIFVLLNTLVAISTNRSALPASGTFVLTP